MRSWTLFFMKHLYRREICARELQYVHNAFLTSMKTEEGVLGAWYAMQSSFAGQITKAGTISDV